MNEETELDEVAPWLAIALTVIGFGLRVLLLSSKGMWMDETFSLWVANHQIADMLQWIARIDLHPPLYYLLLHYWTALNGFKPFDARLLSGLFSTGTIPVIYLVGKRMGGALLGLAAALLLALSPFNIRFAQETRMYSLLAFNASVAIYALVRLLTDPRSIQPFGHQLRQYLQAWRTPPPVVPEPERDFSYKDRVRLAGWRAWLSRHRWLHIQAIETDLAWLAFVVFSAATMLSHNTAVLFPLATNIFVLGLMLFQKTRKPGAVPAFQAPSFGNWMKAQVGIFLLWSPWLVPFIQQARRVYQDFWISKPDAGTVLQAFKTFLNETTIGQGSQAWVIWILYALVLCIGLVHYRKKISQFTFLAVLFAVPLLGELVVSLRRPVFLDKTLIWTTIPLLLVLAAGIAQLKQRLLVIVVLGVLATINLTSAGDYYKWAQKEDWTYPAGFVAKFAEKDDLILFNATRVQIPFDYYFIPWEQQYFLQVEKHGVPVDLFDSGVLEPKMTAGDIPGLVSLLSGHKRVWLVYGYNWNTDPLGLIPQTLAAQMKLIQERDYYGLKVQLYAAP